MTFEDYPTHISPIPPEDGGGYMVSFPDLPGCIADGETINDALAQARDTFTAWCMAEQEDKGVLPIPTTNNKRSV